MNLRVGNTASVIFDLQLKHVVFFGKANFNPRRSGVPDNIRQRLLEDSEEGCIEVRVPLRVLNGSLYAALDASLALPLISLPFDRRGQTSRVKHPRAQFG